MKTIAEYRVIFDQGIDSIGYLEIRKGLFGSRQARYNCLTSFGNMGGILKDAVDEKGELVATSNQIIRNPSLLVGACLTIVGASGKTGKIKCIEPQDINAPTRFHTIIRLG